MYKLYICSVNRANPNQERLLENVEYDEFGAQKFKKGVPHYQSGFPKEHSVCHRSDVDIGGPSYVRLARIDVQNPATRDTTQEPEGRELILT